MGIFTKTKGKVVYEASDGTKYAIDMRMNILPHPRNENLILITDDTSPQETDKGFILKWSTVTIPLASDRNDLIQKLADDYFVSSDETAGSSIGASRKDKSRFLDTIGDGSGTNNFIGNYATPTKGIIKPGPGEILYINRLLFSVIDNADIKASKYGGDIVLANGILIKHEKQNGTLINNITEGMPIMKNSDYIKYGFNISDISLKEGRKHAHGVLTFSKNGTPIVLQDDEQLAVYFNDNFTGLLDHTFRAGCYSQ